MEEMLITNWNRVVHSNDTVYILGDFCFHGGRPKLFSVLEKLRGNKIFINGNHDSSQKIKRAYVEELITEWHEVGTILKKDGVSLHLTHYPMDIGLRKNRFSIHGHIHELESKMPNQINVGVDSPFAKELGKNFGEPISVDEVFMKINEVIGSFGEKFKE
jgi:calcineurin-like phosphoesterase family protein